MTKNPCLNRKLCFFLVFGFSMISRAFGNIPPSFTGGHQQFITACENNIKFVNTQLAITDGDAGQTETWSLLMAPTNGAAGTSFTTTSTGGTITPLGLTYLPASGYTGSDSFQVVISDGTDADTTTIYVTVNPLPPAVSGTRNVCPGTQTTLSNVAGAGTWIGPFSGAILTVDAGTGVVTGVAPGTASVTYTSTTTGCRTAAAVTVNPLPAAATGNTVACTGSSTATVSSASSGGLWTSGNTAVAVIGSTSGAISGISPGTTDITYTLPTGCTTTSSVIVYPSVVSISGTTSICEGNNSVLTGTAGVGTWTSGNLTVATVGLTTGDVAGISAGTATITYILATCGVATTIVTVNPTPPSIIGNTNVCIGGNTITLSDILTGGSWSSGNISTATVNPVTGVVTSVAFGSVPIFYTLGTGCSTVTIVSVNLPPPVITGAGTVCAGLTATLANLVGGGTWSSGNPAIATIAAFGANNGVLNGVAAGTAIITYSPGTGCSVTRVIQAYPLSPIAGTPVFCAGTSTVLTNSTPGGTWSTSSLFLASVSAGGIVTSYSPGTITITYSLPTGCKAFISGTITPLPAPVTGVGSICEGATTTFSDATVGGTWSSLSTTLATLGSSGGFSAIAAGVGTISYSISNGCINTKTIVINPLPTVDTVTGGGGYCAGGAGVVIGLNGSTGSANYFLHTGSSAIGPVIGSGMPISFGLQALTGIYTIEGVMTGTGCRRNMAGTAVVSTIPNLITSVSLTENPGDTICSGTSTIFTAHPVNGGTHPAYQWFVNGTNVGVDTFFYSFLPANGDVVTVKMISNAACPAPDTTDTVVTMYVIPSGIPSADLGITPNDTICAGTTVVVTPFPVYGGSAPNYAWRINGTVIAAGPTLTCVPADGDIIDCIMISNYECTLVTDTVTSSTISMDVAPVIIPRINVTSDPPALTYPGQSLTLTAHVSTTDSVTYQWVLGNVVIPGATNASCTIDTLHYMKNDSVTVYVSTFGICNTNSFTWTFVTNNVGVNSKEGARETLTVSPNPSKGNFRISGIISTTGDEDVVITMSNLVGQTVYSEKVTVKDGVLDKQVNTGGELPRGLYLLNVVTAGTQQVFHITVE